MKQKTSFLPVAVICLVIASLLYVFAPRGEGFFSVLNFIIRPVLSPFGVLGTNHLSELDTVKAENRKLLEKLITFQTIIVENNALRDQFQTTYPKSNLLVPARIVGGQSLVPLVNSFEVVILDKGRKDGVVVGQAVVVGKYLVGKVERVSEYGSRAMLVGNPSFSLRVKIIPKDLEAQTVSFPLGLLKGKSAGQMDVENVLLSEKISVGDMVVSVGDEDEDGIGIMPDLIVGSVGSVDKKPSALFQSAQISPGIKLSNKNMVFVVTGAQR